MDTTQHLNMTTTEITMETQDNGQASFAGARAAIDQARTGVAKAIGHVPEIAGAARHRAGQVGDRLPGAFDRVQSGAGSTVTGLQTMPDSALRLLAVASIGLGAGLRLARAPRLVTLAGFAPASILGFAIVSRRAGLTRPRTRLCRSGGAHSDACSAGGFHPRDTPGGRSTIE